MSQRHRDGFEAIKLEHGEVTRLLSALARKGARTRTGRRGKLSTLPAFDPAAIEAAVATANDAYALLLSATAMLTVSVPPDFTLFLALSPSSAGFSTTFLE